MVAVIQQTADAPTEDAVDTRLAELLFRDFVLQAWHLVEPDRELVPGFYVDAICDHLQAVAEGDIKRLVITLPPGFLKSTLVSVLFPAWLWIDRPSFRFLTTSHDSDLAMRDAVRSRRVIASDWYQARWSERFAMTTDQNVKTRYENDRTGHRISLGTGSGVTGKRGDMILCDDPHDAEDAYSPAALDATVRWWNKTMPSRLNDPKTGAKIVIQQRIHVNDLAGEVISQGYEHLNLPMEYVPTTTVTSIGWKDPRTEPGEVLDPTRYGPQEVAEKKVELGTQAYDAQYQQTPISQEGGMFNRSWWKRYDRLPELTTLEIEVDSAFKDGVENDYSVMALWGKTADETAYLIWVWRARVTFPNLIKMGHQAYEWAVSRFPGMSVSLVVEDKASGQSAIQTWSSPYYTKDRVFPQLPVIAFKVEGNQSKLARADGVTPQVEGGRAYIPAEAPWLDEWLTEHQAFPKVDHDDQVDTTSMALTRLLLNSGIDLAAYYRSQTRSMAA